MRRFCFLSVYGDQIVAGFYLDPRLGERRARRFDPVLSRVNFREAIVAAIGFEIGAQHADADARFLGAVAAADISVRSAQLGDQLADEVGQIAPVSDPGNKRLVTRTNLFPIVAGHRRIPVKIPLDAPGLAESLLPFLARIDSHLQAGKIELAFPDFFAGSGVDHAEHRPGLVEDLLALFIEKVALNT